MSPKADVLNLLLLFLFRKETGAPCADVLQVPSGERAALKDNNQVFRVRAKGGE